MSEIKSDGNQTKSLFIQGFADNCIVVLISAIILWFYESDWGTLHISKDNMLAIHFDMFGTYFTFALILFEFFAPNFIELITGNRLFYRFTDKKHLPTKLVRALKIILSIFCVIFIITMFADKYSRVEFYNDGTILEYNKDNQIINEYTESDIDFIEIRTNYSHIGRHVSYWTEAVVYLKDRDFILTQGDYVTPEFDSDFDIERSLYGLSKVKENFPDKIKINTENIYVLLEVECFSYNQNQAKRLCDIFEIDFDEAMLWLKEEWDIVLESD